MFGLFEDRGMARKAFERLRRGSLAKQVYLVEPFCHCASGREQDDNATLKKGGGGIDHDG